MTARLRPLLLASCLPLLGACALLGGGGKDSKITKGAENCAACHR